MSPEFFLTALIVVLAPGTGVIYTVATGISQGFRAAIMAAFGCTLGILPHLAAATLGVIAVLHTSALLFEIVRYAGVAFLLYLAWQTLRAGGSMDLTGGVKRRGIAVALHGALINVLNPKLSIFFLAFLPQFLSASPENARGEMAMLGAIFMAMTFAVFILYGGFATLARDRVLQSPRVMTWLKRGFAAAFVGLGLKLATEKT